MSEEKREVGRGGGTQETPLQQSWNKNEGPLWEMIKSIHLETQCLARFFQFASDNHLQYFVNNLRKVGINERELLSGSIFPLL